MNNYRDVSDFEINKAVAEELIQSGFIIGIEYYDKHILVTDKYANNYPFAPCNNPADAMPIIFDNNISLILSHNEYPLATNNPSGLFMDALPPENIVTNKNPLRAAMELFLMMKDAENAGKQS